MTRFAAAAALLLALPACCCRGSVQDRVNAAEREHARLKFEVDATEKANDAMRDYAKEVSGGTGPALALYFTDNDIEAFSRRVVPYRIDAKTFNKDLQGTIVVERLHSIVFQPGNKLTAKMELRGQNIRFTGSVPDFAKKTVADFIDGVEAGVIADLDVTLTHQGNSLKALAVCTNTKLKRNSNASNEARLRDEMNKRALRDPVNFDLRAYGYSIRLERVMVTGNHLVVGYRP